MSGVQTNNDKEFTNTQSLTNATPVVWNTQFAPFEDTYEYIIAKVCWGFNEMPLC